MQKLTDQSSWTFSGRSAAWRSGTVENRAAAEQPARRLNPQALEARLSRIRRLSRAMDYAVRIPGTPIRFGLDSVIGLVPGIGDAATAGVSLWIVREAQASGVPAPVLAKMLGNILVDFVGGSVPLAGDLFDVYWKANQRNVELLEAVLRSASR